MSVAAVAKPTPTPAATTALIADPRVPGHDITSWAIDLLHLIGAPITPANVQVMVTWANHESGGYRPGNPVGLYNPLNTTEGAKGYAASGGQQGNIKGFANYQQGLIAQAYNLTHTRGAGYEQILAALKDGNNPQAVYQAIDSSAFGTHNLAAGGATVATTIPAHGATLTGVHVPGTDFTIPTPGDLFAGVADTASFLTALGGVLTNWRYLAEVVGGALIVLLGVRLIIADISGRPVIPRPNVGQVGQAASIAAVAA